MVLNKVQNTVKVHKEDCDALGCAVHYRGNELHTLQRRGLEVYKPPTTPSLKTCSSLEQISVLTLCVIYFNFVYSFYLKHTILFMYFYCILYFI